MHGEALADEKLRALSAVDAKRRACDFECLLRAPQALPCQPSNEDASAQLACPELLEHRLLSRAIDLLVIPCEAT
jgi:hypothetical protein